MNAQSTKDLVAQVATLETAYRQMVRAMRGYYRKLERTDCKTGETIEKAVSNRGLGTLARRGEEAEGLLRALRGYAEGTTGARSMLRALEAFEGEWSAVRRAVVRWCPRQPGWIKRQEKLIAEAMGYLRGHATGSGLQTGPTVVEVERRAPSSCDPSKTRTPYQRLQCCAIHAAKSADLSLSLVKFKANPKHPELLIVEVPSRDRRAVFTGEGPDGMARACRRLDDFFAGVAPASKPSTRGKPAVEEKPMAPATAHFPAGLTAELALAGRGLPRTETTFSTLLALEKERYLIDTKAEKAFRLSHRRMLEQLLSEGAVPSPEVLAEHGLEAPAAPPVVERMTTEELAKLTPEQVKELTRISALLLPEATKAVGALLTEANRHVKGTATVRDDERPFGVTTSPGEPAKIVAGNKSLTDPAEKLLVIQGGNAHAIHGGKVKPFWVYFKKRHQDEAATFAKDYRDFLSDIFRDPRSATLERYLAFSQRLGYSDEEMRQWAFAEMAKACLDERKKGEKRAEKEAQAASEKAASDLPSVVTVGDAEVTLSFPNKPSPPMRERLKSAGFTSAILGGKVYWTAKPSPETEALARSLGPAASPTNTAPPAETAPEPSIPVPAMLDEARAYWRARHPDTDGRWAVLDTYPHFFAEGDGVPYNFAVVGGKVTSEHDFASEEARAAWKKMQTEEAAETAREAAAEREAIRGSDQGGAASPFGPSLLELPPSPSAAEPAPAVDEAQAKADALKAKPEARRAARAAQQQPAASPAPPTPSLEAQRAAAELQAEMEARRAARKAQTPPPPPPPMTLAEKARAALAARAKKD